MFLLVIWYVINNLPRTKWSVRDTDGKAIYHAVMCIKRDELVSPMYSVFDWYDAHSWWLFHAAAI